MKYHTEKYEGYTIEYSVYAPDSTYKGFYGHVDGLGTAYATVGNCHGFPTFDEAQNAARGMVSEFINSVPTSWEMLAEKVTETLVWTGYEDCEVDHEILKTLVTNFSQHIKATK